MFKEVADIKTSDQLHLPVPEAKFETVVAKPSEIQKEMVQELSKRAADIHSGIVDASVDNMLCITNDGRKIGLDQRLMNPLLPDDPASKLNACVRNVLQIWEDGREQKLTQFPADIQQQRAHISALKTDAEMAAAHPQDKENFCGMTIKGMMFDDKKTAGERLILAAKELPDTEPVVLGEYRGFELSVRYEPVRNEQQAVLKGKAIYPVALGADPHGNITRLDNLLAGFDERIANAENRLENLLQQQTAAQAEVEKTFPQEEELAQKSARLAELNAQLDVDEKHHEPEMEETPDEESARPSVLAALNEKSDKEEPVKPFRSYSDRDGDAR